MSDEPLHRNFDVFLEQDPSRPVRIFVVASEEGGQHEFETANEAKNWIASRLEQDGHPPHKAHSAASAIVGLVASNDATIRFSLH